MASGLSVEAIGAGMPVGVAVEETAPARTESPEVVAAASNPSTEQVPTTDYAPEQLRENAEAFGRAVTLINPRVKVEFDDTTERFITQVIDRETNEVVRQIPPEELVKTIRKLREYIGLLLDVEV